MGQPAFLQLPLHLVSQVLVQLDDLQTLAAALASHSLLYAAYKDVGATTVLLAILRNRIPENIMPYAIMAYKARTIDRQEVRTLVTCAHFRGPPHRILGRYVQHQLLRDDGDAPHAVPRFAAALIKTHSAVQYFCDRFIQEARPLAPQFIAAHPASSALGPPSSTEVYRVQRALYRFQAYCNLRVRQKGDFDDDIEEVRGRKNIWRQIEPFLSAFSPWVNEQLACIHDFLERGLSQCEYLHFVLWMRVRPCFLLLTRFAPKHSMMLQRMMSNGALDLSTGYSLCSSTRTNKHMYVLYAQIRWANHRRGQSSLHN